MELVSPTSSQDTDLPKDMQSQAPTVKNIDTGKVFIVVAGVITAVVIGFIAGAHYGKSLNSASVYDDVRDYGRRGPMHMRLNQDIFNEQ